MKYWKFDVCELIRDYPRNKKTLGLIRKELELCEAMIVSPEMANERESWIRYAEILRLREIEYDTYVDIVREGLGDLPEVSRNVLTMKLIDEIEDDAIIEHCAIKDSKEYKKIFKIALTQFSRLAGFIS